MNAAEVIISAGITIFSLGLLIVSLASYKKYKNKKLLIISVVFLLFFSKGILMSIGLFDPSVASLLSRPYVGVFDLMILVVLFVATLKR